MEDMARLALVEQSVRDTEGFSKILHELLQQINQILESPHDFELRTIRNETLKKYLQFETLVDYLKSIGFQSNGEDFTYPKEQRLNKLRMAQAAIERKIHFCYGPVSHKGSVKTVYKLPRLKPPILTPVNILTTTKPLLLKLQSMFNDVLQYEDEELQAKAREYIPLVTLQLMALDEMREHQKQIKIGESKERDMPFDIALLRVLLSWFKHRFFSWVDAPACAQCGGDTAHTANDRLTADGENCRLEIYKCLECSALTEFPRYNKALTLLRTRRGRCGEWANCFALLCRALGYDTRLVTCTTDHVWCEVWDYDTNTWLHVDPCEESLGAPLMYSKGWGKRLSYVLAVSRDDLQDVTWRYTTQHKEVMKLRTECTETELLDAIMTLRTARQKQVSEARRRFLARRNLEELVELMTERTVSPRELNGRVSGAAAWRRARGEGGGGRVFRFNRPGDCSVAYYITTDRYEMEGEEEKELQGWAAGVFTAHHVFRKVERDWKMVYLAREEESAVGVVSWALEAGPGLQFSSLRARARSQEFEEGRVMWTLSLDGAQPAPADISEHGVEWSCRFNRAELTARLSGAHWQHAQLFRAPTAPRAQPPQLLLQATLTTQV